MKKEKAIELIHTFPQLTDQNRQQIESYFERYITYSRTSAHCTACNHTFDEKETITNFNFPELNNEFRSMCSDLYTLEHKNYGLCPHCGSEVKFIKAQHIKHNEYYQGKKNFMVFLAHENRLYIRCFIVSLYLSHEGFERYEYLERQRYIFCSDGYVRLGPDDTETYYYDYNGYSYQGRRKVAMDEGEWSIRTRVTEPVFNTGMWYTDNSYNVIGEETISETYAKYCCVDMWEHGVIKYLKFWNKHKNVEYLLKSGFKDVVTDHVVGGYSYIDWKQNDMKKMMHIDGHELKIIQSSSIGLRTYLSLRDEFKGFKPEELIDLNDILKYQLGTFAICCKASRCKPYELYKYLSKQRKKCPQITITEYSDYMKECQQLKYDLKLDCIRLPKSLYEMHMRTSGIIAELERKADEARLLKIQKKNAENIKKRQLIPLSDDELGLMLKIPDSIQEIVDEGKRLNHCVGSYAKRHNEGCLTIAFIRKISKPDAPYYTVEISNDGEVKQCRGFKNKDSNAIVSCFLKLIKEHLSEIYEDKSSKKNVKKSA